MSLQAREQGWKRLDIAEALGVTEGAVSWGRPPGTVRGGCLVLGRGEALRRTIDAGPERLSDEDRQKRPALPKTALLKSS